MQLLKTLDALLARIVQPILVTIGLAVAVILVVGIFARAVLRSPVFGLEEIMLLSIMWFYMLGAALASRERSHLTADFVKVLSSNPKVWRMAALISTVISLLVAVMFVTWAWDLFAFGLERGQSTPVFAIPWWVSQSSLFAASVLFVIYLLRDLFLELTEKDPSAGGSSAEAE